MRGRRRWTGPVLLVAVGALAYAAGRMHAPAPAARRVLYYHDPMHPAYRSDRPGVAPDCGMQLEPVFADGEAAPAGPPGAVQISAERQQLAGVRTAVVERGPRRHLVRLPGRVAAAEDRVYRISTRVDGWVRQVFPSTTGARVRRGQPLVAVYGREYRMAQQSYIYALKALDGHQGQSQPLDQSKLSVNETRANLLSLGMDPDQIEEIGRTGVPALDIRLVSPVDGLIVMRQVTLNQKFEPGTELYRVEDLRRVWIVADLFATDAARLHPGAPAQVSLPSAPGQVWSARVSDSLPRFDAATRSLKVRLELDNPDLELRPDMLVDVELPVELAEAVTVPESAVVDGGREQTVFVDRGNGFFEPRPVRTGWRLDGVAQVLSGLQPGERVVAAGTFLVDAESRLGREAGASAVHDPVCGMKVDPGTARHRDFGGKVFYFCSDRCQHQMEQDPARYRREGT
jgi:Cu(I)/Ag(I) efflux system membrane fusion protein